MCDGYADCYEVDEYTSDVSPEDCSSGCGSFTFYQRMSDSQIEDEALLVRSWTRLPCGHEVNKEVVRYSFSSLEMPSFSKVDDPEPWTDPARSPAPVKKTSRLKSWVKRMLRR